MKVRAEWARTARRRAGRGGIAAARRRTSGGEPIEPCIRPPPAPHREPPPPRRRRRRARAGVRGVASRRRVFGLASIWTNESLTICSCRAWAWCSPAGSCPSSSRPSHRRSCSSSSSSSRICPAPTWSRRLGKGPAAIDKGTSGRRLDPSTEIVLARSATDRVQSMTRILLDRSPLLRPAGAATVVSCVRASTRHSPPGNGPHGDRVSKCEVPNGAWNTAELTNAVPHVGRVAGGLPLLLGRHPGPEAQGEGEAGAGSARGLLEGGGRRPCGGAPSASSIS